MKEPRAVTGRQVTAACFPAPRQPAVVRARWHGPPGFAAAGVATSVAADRDGAWREPPSRHPGLPAAQPSAGATAFGRPSHL